MPFTFVKSRDGMFCRRDGRERLFNFVFCEGRENSPIQKLINLGLA